MYLIFLNSFLVLVRFDMIHWFCRMAFPILFYGFLCMLNLKNVVHAMGVVAIFSVGMVKAGAGLSSGQFGVKGEIGPAACSVVFEGDNTYDFGLISSEALKKGDGKFFTKTGGAMPFKVVCDNMSDALKIQFKDVNHSSVHDAMKDKKDVFGLGEIDNVKVGFFKFTVKDSYRKVMVTEDGKDVMKDDVKYGRSEDGSAWVVEGGTDRVYNEYYYTPVREKDGVVSPVAFKEFHSAVDPQIYIDRNLSVTEVKPFSGLVNLELSYI